MQLVSFTTGLPTHGLFRPCSLKYSTKSNLPAGWPDSAAALPALAVVAAASAGRTTASSDRPASTTNGFRTCMVDGRQQPGTGARYFSHCHRRSNGRRDGGAALVKSKLNVTLKRGNRTRGVSGQCRRPWVDRTGDGDVRFHNAIRGTCVSGSPRRTASENNPYTHGFAVHKKLKCNSNFQFEVGCKHDFVATPPSFLRSYR